MNCPLIKWILNKIWRLCLSSLRESCTCYPSLRSGTSITRGIIHDGGYIFSLYIYTENERFGTLPIFAGACREEEREFLLCLNDLIYEGIIERRKHANSRIIMPWSRYEIAFLKFYYVYAYGTLVSTLLQHFDNIEKRSESNESIFTTCVARYSAGTFVRNNWKNVRYSSEMNIWKTHI